MARVKFTTNYGEIVINLFKDIPITTENFLEHVKKGTYNNTIFHRIIPDFMIQGGDPTGTGFGDPNIPNIPDEFIHSSGNKNNRGTISMANAGPNTGSTQFFLNLVDNNYLDKQHPVFGKVIKGLDVMDEIQKVKTDRNDKPIKPVKLERAEVIQK